MQPTGAPTKCPHYLVSVEPWVSKAKSSRAMVLYALWSSQPDPFAPRPLVVLSQSTLMKWTRLGERTVRDSLAELRKAQAIDRYKLPSGATGYWLNRHPDAETDPRLGPFPPPDSRTDPPSASSPRRPSRERRDGRERFPAGLEPSDVAAVLTAELGLAAPLYSGPEVCSAGEAMVAEGWTLDELAEVCRAYREDNRSDKPKARALFFAKHRATTIEHYGPTGSEHRTSPPSPPKPSLTREQWLEFFTRLCTPDEAEVIVREHGERIDAMGRDGIKAAVTAWQAQRDGTPLASIFTERVP